MFKKVQKAIPKTAAIAAIATGKSGTGAPACDCSAKAPAAKAPAAKVPEKKKKTSLLERFNQNVDIGGDFFYGAPNFLEFGENEYGLKLPGLGKAAADAAAAMKKQKSLIKKTIKDNKAQLDPAKKMLNDKIAAAKINAASLKKNMPNMAGVGAELQNVAIAQMLYGEQKKRLKMTKKAIAARRAYRLKKSRKRSRRASPKRRKISQKTAHARAKRAMKLHHSKGISLKQAWRIVLKKNKFGDSVCGRGYEVNRNWSRGKGQKQCLKECDFYEMRDHSTNRCKKMTMVKRSYGNVPLSKQAKLPRGYEINPETGRQRKICPRGYYRNPDTGRCKKIQTSLKSLKSSKQDEDLDELDSVNFRWKKGKNIPLSMQYGHSCFGSVPCDCGI